MARHLEDPSPKDYEETYEGHLQRPREEEHFSQIAQRILEQVVSALLIASIISILGFGYTVWDTLRSHSDTVLLLKDEDIKTARSLATLEEKMYTVELFMIDGKRFTQAEGDELEALIREIKEELYRLQLQLHTRSDPNG